MKSPGDKSAAITGSLRKPLSAALILLTFLAIQSGVIFAMYHGASSSLSEALHRRLHDAAGSAAGALSFLDRSGENREEMNRILWRTRESDRFDDAILINSEFEIVAGRAETSGGAVPCSLFTANPSLVREVFEGEGVREERVTLLGDEYHRIYYPVEDPAGLWSVLCIDSFNTVSAGLSNLEAPFYTGLAVIIATTFVMTLALILVMKILERARKNSLRMARLATAGTLSASIAHEVKNPLGIILANAQLLKRKDNLDDRTRESLEDIEEEVHRASEQIDSFLDMTRKTPLKKESRDLGELVGSSSRLLEVRAGSSGVTLEMDIPESPIEVEIDARKFKQAYVNLVLNAVEAIEEKGEGGKVRVKLDKTSGGEVRLSVSDDGPGIGPDELKTVFEPFFSTKETGTGLGLPAAKQVAEDHGGRIEIKSSSLSGTEVIITVPGSDGSGRKEVTGNES